MSTDSISDYLTTASTTSTTSTSSSTTSSFDMEDFLAMMVAELQNQDMYNTADTNEFMSQMATYTMIESINEMTVAMEDLSELSLVNYGMNLIGKDVTVVEEDADGNYTTVEGTVESVNFYNGDTEVVVDGTSYSLSSVMEIQDASE